MRIATSKVIEENYKSSFMSCEKDQETIWKKLFIDTKDYSNKLKKLLVINSPQSMKNLMKRLKNMICGN